MDYQVSHKKSQYDESDIESMASKIAKVHFLEDEMLQEISYTNTRNDIKLPISLSDNEMNQNKTISKTKFSILYKATRQLNIEALRASAVTKSQCGSESLRR